MNADCGTLAALVTLAGYCQWEFALRAIGVKRPGRLLKAVF